MSEVAHASMRGAVAAMAMTGMRALTVSLGLVRESPPRAIIRKRARPAATAAAQAPARRDRAGALGLRRRRRDAVRAPAGRGAAPGLGGTALRARLWLGFELGVAPAVGLAHARRPRTAERAALAADHALYGLVLSEMRSRPRE